MSDFKPKSPDFNASAISRNNPEHKGRIGSAWKNDDGTITVRLNPFVTVDDTVTITLFENEPRGEKFVRNPKF